MARTDANGNALGTVAYGPYGEGADPGTTRFGYTGQMALQGTGLYYMKARVYAPSLGRFLEPDPIGFAGGLNLYAYTGGDPINFTDPLGLNKEAFDDCDRIGITNNFLCSNTSGGGGARRGFSQAGQAGGVIFVGSGQSPGSAFPFGDGGSAGAPSAPIEMEKMKKGPAVACPSGSKTLLGARIVTRESSLTVIVRRDQGTRRLEVQLTSLRDNLTFGRIFPIFKFRIPRPGGNGVDIMIVEGNILSPSRKENQTIPLDTADPEIRLLEVRGPGFVDIRGRTFAPVDVVVTDITDTGGCK